MKMLVLAHRNLRELLRDPLTVLLGVAMPVGLYLLFVAIGQRAPLDIFRPAMMAPAVIAFSFAFLIMFTAMLVARDRQSGLLARFLTMPLGPADFVFAYALPVLPVALLQAAACQLTGLALGNPLGLRMGLDLLVQLPLALCCIGLGLLIGSVCNENQVSGVGSILITVVGVFSGAWMDLAMVGGAISAIGHALPFAHAVDATRSFANGQGLADNLDHLAAVLIWAAVITALGMAVFGRKVRPQ